MSESSSYRPITPLSAYERYYQSADLATYAAVFELTNEKEIEADLCAGRIAGITEDKRALRILDIGCGLGAFTCRLLRKLGQQRNGRVDALRVECDLVDINPLAFAEFRRAASKVAAECEVTITREVEGAWQHVGIDLPQGTYDLVIANHVFYGCACDEELVRALRRLLKPNGVVLVALVTSQSDLIRLRADAGIPNNTADDFGHVLAGTLGSYTRVLYDCKFRFHRDDPRHVDWFFASGDLKPEVEQMILGQYARKDDISDYIANRAAIFLLQG